MFELALVEDSIGLPAAYLGTASSFKEAIRIEILKKYANKVINSACHRSPFVSFIGGP